MAEDPYKVLGVARDAPDEEIRRTYRKLAKQLHPDVNPANRATAEEKFKKVSAAYDIIGDPEKRKQFDRGEIDANGEPRRGFHRTHSRGGPFGGRAGGRPEEDFGFGDIFSDLFGRGRGGEAGGPFAARGRDVRYTLEIDFLEAATGAKKRVTMPDGGVLDLTVPEGVADGQTLRLKGKGSPGPRGSDAGDALVEIRVRPHPHFKRVGDDIALDLPITIDDKLSYFMSEWRQTHRYDPGRS
jgi:DnaJ-class molecular chaperone